MTDFNVPNGLAVFLSGYLKRVLEGQYDKLSEISAFEKLKGQPQAVKYGMEASLYAITAAMEQYLGEDTFLKKTLKEVGLDFGSEFSKRLLNGDNIKDAININQDNSQNIHNREFIGVLADLNEKDLLEFLNWMESTTQKERKNILRNISKLSEEDILKVFNLNPETREKLLKFSVKASST